MSEGTSVDGVSEGAFTESVNEVTSLADRLAILADRLANPDAVLLRTDLRDLGWGRRAIDAFFRACPTIHVPGYGRPAIKVRDYLEVLESCTFRDDRVLP